MTRQRRPNGTFRTATADMKVRILERMAELGMSRADLARETKATTAAMSQFFGREGTAPKTSSTKLLPAIYKALKWPPPDDDSQAEIVDDLHDELTTIWQTLDSTERAVLQMIVARRTKQS